MINIESTFPLTTPEPFSTSQVYPGGSSTILISYGVPKSYSGEVQLPLGMINGVSGVVGSSSSLTIVITIPSGRPGVVPPMVYLSQIVLFCYKSNNNKKKNDFLPSNKKKMY